MIIAIDGPAGSGKSTVAKLIAEKYHAVFMNTGSFYRALALALLRSVGGSCDGTGAVQPPLTDEQKLVTFAKNTALDYRDGAIHLAGENVEPYIRSDAVEALVAPLSAIIPIRHIINEKIRDAARNSDIVCEGRDMTTVVFPHAEHKFYLDASVEARTRRRFSQGTSTLSEEEIKAAIEKRDEIDRNKKEGSLKKAEDAYYLDTSDLTIMQVCEKITTKIHDKGLSMERKEVALDAVTNSDQSIQTQLPEEYLNFESPEVGSVKEGRIIAVTDDSVFIDVGGKSEGRVERKEFSETPNVGDTVQVYIEKTEADGGKLSISKQKADRIVLRKELQEAYRNKTPVSGVIVKTVNKSGFDVDLGAGMIAFLPISQAASQKIDKPETLLKRKETFYIEKMVFDRKGNRENIVVNRRKYLEDTVEKERDAFFENTNIGDVVQGTVKSFTSFGAFIDLGGFDGLLHINDMSWGHVTRPKDFVKKGQEIELKVIRLDPAEKRINLSLKHFSPDPWLEFEDKFQVNDVVKGHVTKITDFGAFVELSEGIEGLVHISEFSWVKKISKPSDMVKIGDEVECMILGYDIQAGRVSLGLKQVTANPWNNIDEHYPVGTRLTRKVVKLTNAGAFIELEEGIDGFLHVDDISWTKRVRHPNSELEVGQELEVIVIECDPEGHRIRLGIKQLSDDPWKTFADAYRPGAFVEGEVTSITDFGIFVKVPGGIEGLIHKQNLVESRDDNPDEVLKKYAVGDAVKAVVLDVNVREKKTAFSIRDYKKRLQQEELSRYMSTKQEDSEGSFTLGDLMKNKAGE
ncbi:MAG: 30S ribosomal protein S1 [Treponema sp.]